MQLREYFRKYFFAKRSLGKDGKEIWALKFKTIDDEVSKALSTQVVEFYDYGHMDLEGKISKFNQFLRRHFIDEIPQLYNVLLKRDMSLVGIRPMRDSDWQHYPADIKAESLKYKPGLMGIQYVLKDKGDFEECKKEMRRYLDKKARHPYKTAVEYLFKISYNILFRGIRSR